MERSAIDDLNQGAEEAADEVETQVQYVPQQVPVLADRPELDEEAEDDDNDEEDDDKDAGQSDEDVSKRLCLVYKVMMMRVQYVSIFTYNF